MGQCYAKNIPVAEDEADAGDGEGAVDHDRRRSPSPAAGRRPRGTTPARSSAASPWPSPYPAGVSPSPARSTPRRFFRRPFPPPSPAKHIKASLAKRHGKAQAMEGTIPEEEGGGGEGGGQEVERPLDKSFGYGRNFGAKYEIGKEMGRGHFGHTCSARGRKGEMRGQQVAVKIISKAKMTTAISIEDVRREVKILKALSVHTNLVKFFDACEDALNVYIIMELCEGGELLDRILSRGGRYTEEDAKVIVVQMLSVVAFCHLQGVVHRDLKPENFLFSTREENSPMKIIDFGLSDFIRPDERLNDIVGSAYYVAPEVLHRSYSMEADIWSIGVIAYILLCGSRPFWARTESGIFRSVLRADPNFDDLPWPSASPEAKDFVKRLLNKDYRKRMTAAQALTHPWLRDEQRQVPLDILVFKLVKAYLHATPLKRAALKALSKALTEDELFYIKWQYNLLEPNKNGWISLENFKKALYVNATEAMRESRVLDILNALEPLTYRWMDFEEFCAATISPYQLEALENWEQIAGTAFEHFELEGNRVITVEELAQEMNLPLAAYSIVRDWVRPADGKLSFLGYTKFLHGVTMRSSNTRHRH
ncbi:CDPK-related kinase 3-like [Typha latifolia]|uniref:CDPK-related kinase 3-like n=1 Tax=Typha latifolia TaxID=4733 RepID=UPI003C2CF76B